MFISSAGLYTPLMSYHGYRLIDPPVGTEKLTADLQLDPGKTVAGKVVGPDGKPFRGATVAGLAGTLEVPATLKDDTFTAAALLPEDSRTVAAVHAGKKLAGTVVVSGAASATPVVRLGKWGILTGRVVDHDGKPIAGVRVRLYFEDRAAALLHHHLAGDQSATTDAAGRFRCDVPFAGVK